MLKQILFSALALASVTANAASITSAKIDGSKIVLDVRYGGGCKEHQFSIAVRGCFESMPVKCQADLVHNVVDGPDFCEAIISQTVEIPFADAGIVGDYFDGGSLAIKDASGNETKLRLPDPIPPASASPVNAGQSVRCVTHTGSLLDVDTKKKQVTIRSTDGRDLEVKITKIDTLILESIPAVEQNTYRLEDGRSIVVSVRDGEKKGTGYYIRVGGDTSPSFQCTRTN